MISAAYLSRRGLLAGALALGACGPKPEVPEAKATASVSATSPSGSTTKLPYVVFYESGTDPGPKKYVLGLIDYDPCVWAATHDPSLQPRSLVQLGMYLLNQTNGTVGSPSAGVYKVQAPAATGTSIDPKTAAFGITKDCQGNFVALSGGAVTLTQINNGAASGSLDISLTDGTKIRGDFTTATCSGPLATTYPENDPDVCPAP